MTAKKRILLVTNGFYPEISPRSYRATELTMEFCRQGHEVTVISKFRTHDYADFLKKYPITFKMWGRSRFPKVPQFNRKPFSFFGRAIYRLLSVYFEYPSIEQMFQIRKVLKRESDYDLIISFAVPYAVHWGVAWSRTKHQRIAGIWVADCGDPYMGDVLDTFRKPFYFRYLEKWFCRKADFISIPIENAKAGYYSEFHRKIEIIPQGFYFAMKRGIMRRPINSIPTFAYAGSFLLNVRDPRPLMNFLKDVTLPFVFKIYTNTPELLTEYKEMLNEKLIVSSYIPRDQLLEELTSMDFLINFDNNTTLNSPSKLIDYAIVDRPVLNLTKDFVGDAILAFLRGDYKDRMPLPDPGCYHISTITQHFLRLLK